MERVQGSAFLFLIFENVNNYRCIELSSLTYVEDESDFSLINAIRYSSCRPTLCLRCYSMHLHVVESLYSNAHVPFPALIQWNYTIISNISCWKNVNQNQNLCTIYEMKILGFLFYWMRFKQHRKITSSFNCYLQMPPEAAVVHTHASVSHYSQSEHRKQQLISQSERAGDSQ